MAITTVDKMKINKYLKEHAIGDIYYLDMCDYLGKRGKITDIEFLEYFTDFVLNEFRQIKKISMKQVAKMISVVEAFLGWIHEENSNISDEALDKIRSFKEFFDEYLSKNEVDEEDVSLVNSNIDALLDTINELYPNKKNSESVSKYISQIAELEEYIGILEKELQELKRVYGNLQVAHDDKASKVELLSARNSSLVQDARDRKSEIKKLKELISSLESRISELETVLSQTKEENAMLSSYKEQYEVLKVSVEELHEIVSKEVSAREAREQLEIKHSNIEALIYQKLLFDGASIDDILSYVKSQGIISDRSEITSLLRRIKQRINIDSSLFINKPTYKVEAPRLVRDDVFKINIPFGCKYYDVMLVSDFHIKEFDKKVLKGFDAINDYCVKNNINLVLNLGDFFDGYGSNPLAYENAVKNYQIIEQAITSVERADGIYHAILGGNHDRHIAQYGFDPISILASERDDFINLGYTHSTVCLTSLSNVLGSFDIHHPDTFDFPIKIGEEGIDMNGINGYLTDLYSKQEHTRDDSYIDIFGHMHKSQINYPGSYCYVPPFFEGGVKKGAYHLRIYFDEDTGIECMLFMPLSFGTKLEKNNEIVYQKILQK